jgi:nicotinamide-nucleotide amidase
VQVNGAPATRTVGAAHGRAMTTYPPGMTTGPDRPRGRPLRTAELLAVGSELTTGETRDTNGGELARSLAIQGVSVQRIIALPDELALVIAAFADALESVDLVVATGGLGPTPDDLTREAVAAAVGEEPTVDPHLEAWLRDLFARRGIRLPEANLKQAWRIPSATSIPNPNGTAPGWWVDRPDGRVAVLLPGPPREMGPMWSDWVVPRLLERGLGDGRLVRTLRTYGIGESHVAERLGEPLLRGSNPVVATYARADWLDIRISAVDETDEAGSPGQAAAALVEATAERVREMLAGYVKAEGETSWADLVADSATRAGVRLAVVEAGTHGALGNLLADVAALERDVTYGPAIAPDPDAWPVEAAAADAARDAGVGIGAALVAHADTNETRLRVAVAAPEDGWSRVLDLRLFQHGAHGRFRAAVAAAAFIVEVLDERAANEEDPTPC